jgi:hypothetical protein
MSAPLSKRQKFILADLARIALQRAFDAGEIEVSDLWEMPRSRAEEIFRHRIVAAAVGKPGLRCCTQEDFMAIKAVLLERIGNYAGAFEARMREATNERRVAAAVLDRELKRFGFDRSYAAAIAARQFRVALADASPHQLWCLIFTIRSRGYRRRRRDLPADPQTQATPPAPAGPPSPVASPQ